jgi:NAD(P)H-quinone oxidoreductase subunit 5
MVTVFKGDQLVLIKRISSSGIVVGLIASLVAGIFIYKNGPTDIEYFSFWNLGLSFRLDNLSVLMFSMITVLGLVILRFSFNYLEGERNHGRFIGILGLTIGVVELLVLSGNLFILFITWYLTSLGLHKLLVFYKDRPKAAVAAKKKTIIARIGEFFMLIGFSLIYVHFGTGNLTFIFNNISEFSTSSPVLFELSIVSIVIAAFCKSAQFPGHGWLVEVMETPTPVSALLHAGILNAGPFLMIRFAHVLDVSLIAPILIIVVAGFTAFFGAVCFTTQPAQKTALAYSSIAHMGFSMLSSGLGLYGAGMLHLVAHSFYKGHAFLSSGSAVDLIRAKKVKAPKRKGNVGKMILGFLFSLSLYFACALIWNVLPQDNLPLFMIGAILILGVTQLMITALDGDNYFETILRSAGLGFIITAAFFTFESVMHNYLAPQMPAEKPLIFIQWLLIGLIWSIFFLTVMAQIIAPLFPKSHFWKAMGIHFRNGWYINAYFDKWMGALNTAKVYEKESANDAVILPKHVMDSKA